MVYGLNVKPEYGYYIAAEPMDGDLKLVTVADKSADGGVMFQPTRKFSSGRAVTTENMPTKMRWLDRQHHKIPDFDDAQVTNVSQRTKDLIERFEPNVHQLIPVEYHDIDGKFLEHRFFLIVCKRLDTLDRNRTTMILVDGKMWLPPSDLESHEIPAGIDPSVPAKMVFNLSQIGGAHLWCDKHLLSGGPFISDDLASAIRAEGLTGLRLSDAGVETV